MSRCFPFPPPGYEKKASPDDEANLLIKEKQKEVNRKKDKKDKEKKDKKKKKEKGSSTGEKKDRKKKHRDKKDKNSEKETKRVSKEETVVVPSEHKNGEKLSPTTALSVRAQDSTLLFELEKRVGHDSGERQIKICDKLGASNNPVESQRKASESNFNSLAEGYQTWENGREASNLPNEKYFLVNATGVESGFVRKSLAEERRSVEGVGVQGKEVSEKQKYRKDKTKHKDHDGIGDKHKDRDKDRKSKSKDKKRKKEKVKDREVKDGSVTVLCNLKDSDSNRGDFEKDRMCRPLEEKDANNWHHGKRKNGEMNGFLHGNEILVNRMPKVVALSEVVQNGSGTDSLDTGIRFGSGSDSSAGKPTLNIKVLSSNSVDKNEFKSEWKQTAFDLATGRQEEILNHKKAYGLSSSHASLPNGKTLERVPGNLMVNRTASSSHLLSENGRKLDRGRHGDLISEKQKGHFCNPKIGGQESGITGLVGLESVCLEPSLTLEQSRKAVETNTKPPHPDAKYLCQLLTVPKAEAPALDDQLWLVTSKDHLAKKLRVDSSSCESRQVWAEALSIESMDVTALPYVIPY